MIEVLLIWLGAIAVVVIIAFTGSWAIQREPAGHGQHGVRREHPSVPLRRRVAIHWECRKAWPANILARLRNGEGWRDAWACRWAPPMARTLAPLPPVPDRLDEMVAEFHATKEVMPNEPVPVLRSTGLRVDLPAVSAPGRNLHGHGGEPSNKSMGNWPMPHLERTWADSTGSFAAIRDEPVPAPSPVTPDEEFAGGALDPNLWARFDAVTARAREVLGRIPVGVG